MYLWKGAAKGLLLGAAVLILFFGWDRAQDRRYERLHDAIDRLEAGVEALESRSTQEQGHDPDAT